MPRYIPKHERQARPQPPAELGLDAAEEARERAYLRSLEKTSKTAPGPYAAGGPHSYFGDLLAVAREQRQMQGEDGQRFALLPEPSEPPAFGDPDAEQARQRLALSQRDVSSSSGSVPDLLRPSMPGRLREIFGRAARRTSGLADALPRLPLERGAVDTTGSQMVVRFPALSTGTAVAAQSENQAVQETDPTSAGIAAPLGSLAGQVDASKQLTDFSAPAIDEVLADDLGARLGEALDAELYNGAGSASHLKGFLQWSGILSITGSVTNQAAYLQSIWQAYSQVAGTSGYGDADRANFLTVMHPRRFSWLQAGYAVPAASLLPGTLVLVPNAPANLGGSTNEDWALVLDRQAVQLVAAAPTIRVYEEVGSSTGTIRFSAHADAALGLLNAKALAKVTGGTPPSGF